MSDVLSPKVIPITPFPTSQGADISSSTQVSGGNDTKAANLQPANTPEVVFPEPVIARHTVGDSIDTSARRIKGVFQLDKSGGIQVGQYQNGVSGEVDITPNGIVAKNANNEQTFVLDATTGDATFMGTVQAGSLIAGDSDVVIGKGTSGGGRIVIFNNGIPSIIIGDPS